MKPETETAVMKAHFEKSKREAVTCLRAMGAELPDNMDPCSWEGVMTMYADGRKGDWDMKVSRELASQRIDEYMVRVLMPKLKGGKDDNAARFKIGVAHTMGWLGITDEQFAEAKEMGLVDGEGNIDMELVRKGVAGGVSAAGGELFVKKLGVWLSADDLSKMVDYVESGAQQG